jgi:hypothetical protein
MKIIIFLMTLLWTTSSYATLEEYDLYFMQMPMVCGEHADVDRYITDNKFTPINVSFGKEGSSTDGEIVFVLTYYINDKKETLAVAQTANDPYTCMIFHTFDMRMNEKLLGTDT